MRWNSEFILPRTGNPPPQKRNERRSRELLFGAEDYLFGEIVNLFYREQVILHPKESNERCSHELLFGAEDYLFEVK